MIAKLNSNEPVAMMVIYYEYEIIYAYIYRQYMIELSLCDICKCQWLS